MTALKHALLAALLLAPLFAAAQAPSPAPPPASSAPSAPTYAVSPGDVLDVTFRWTPEFNQTVTVQPDGNSVINAVGAEVRLAGLTVQQIHDLLIGRTSARLINPEIDINLHDVDRPHVLVGGEVTTPGRVDLRHATTAFEAIFLAGGAKDSANMSHVVLFRRVNSEYSQVFQLDFHRFDSGHKPRHDMLLQPGDMILVPRDGLTKFGRYVRTLNLGAFFSFNPFGTNGFF
jgi:polysaccharide export outer membrane protein